MNGTLTPAQAKIEEQPYLDEPSVPPPPGISSNLINPPNQDAVVIALCTIFFVLVTVSGVIRLYTKLRLIRAVELEDYVLLLAWVGLIAYTVLALIWVHNGGGRHMWNIKLRSYIRIAYLTSMSGIVYCITIFLVKASILLQYLRVFVPNRKADWSLYITIQVVFWSCFVFYTVILFVQIFSCHPRERIWNFYITSGGCLNSSASSLSTGIFNIVSDFAILILPMVPISRLQLPLQRKLLLIAVFATGIFACAISILGTVYRRKVELSRDWSWDNVVFGLWTEAEVIVGFVLSCVPVMPKFFQHLGPKLYTTFSFRPGSKARVLDPVSYPQSNFREIGHGARRFNGSDDPLTSKTRDYINLGPLKTTSPKDEDQIDEAYALPPRTVRVHSADLEDETMMV